LPEMQKDWTMQVYTVTNRKFQLRSVSTLTALLLELPEQKYIKLLGEILVLVGRGESLMSKFQLNMSLWWEIINLFLLWNVLATSI